MGTDHDVDVVPPMAYYDTGDMSVLSATVRTGVMLCLVGPVGEDMHCGCGALHRVIRDGTPPCGK